MTLFNLMWKFDVVCSMLLGLEPGKPKPGYEQNWTGQVDWVQDVGTQQYLQTIWMAEVPLKQTQGKEMSGKLLGAQEKGGTWPQLTI